MVRQELATTLEQASRDLELYGADRKERHCLESCRVAAGQLAGVFKLLGFTGANLLAEDLSSTLVLLPAAESDRAERLLELCGRSLFVLNRYLEHIQQSERALPLLLIPYINDLRKLRGEPLLPESHFLAGAFKSVPRPPEVEPIAVSEAEFYPLVARLRHMYQLGLLGILRDLQVPASLNLMRRALLRLQRLGNDKPLASLWWLGNLAVDALLSAEMELLDSRKFALSRIDRIIRQVQKGGPGAFDSPPAKSLLKELYFIYALAGRDSAMLRRLQGSFDTSPLDYDESLLKRERRALRGPNAHTVAALVRELRTEITAVKVVLEAAAQVDRTLEDAPGLNLTLHQVAETLSLVGMLGPAALLREALAVSANWRNKQPIDEADLDQLAKALLFVESAVTAVEFSRVSREALEDTSEAGQNQIIAHSELARAEQIVLQECEAGVALVKRALTSYAESNFDLSHIRNIGKTLETVRGGLWALGRRRAAALLQNCVGFVEGVLLESDKPAALKELLETFADAVISIEYYLNTAKVAERLDDSVLEVAEESLAALGFAPTRDGD